ncbi:hypothetical protein M430DRAFT_30429 [Amorphotheca resinae ATCC 22711]|uniref:Uncharacterized protein n=1 Tax=Amorphotheca resinae ATCC 22711 TaxID=857342 RepID=A0A2T3ASN8_AMORE|nr:hypothetical protein M430DRAFT_30429 [Amorphotheca resinae ATCC 22711]PSS10496.1 hypothetical protein M430DRAFT_30429 [Amorphotheca resinae ATCC 22711]
MDSGSNLDIYITTRSRLACSAYVLNALFGDAATAEFPTRTGPSRPTRTAKDVGGLSALASEKVPDASGNRSWTSIRGPGRERRDGIIFMGMYIYYFVPLFMIDDALLTTATSRNARNERSRYIRARELVWVS